MKNLTNLASVLLLTATVFSGCSKQHEPTAAGADKGKQTKFSSSIGNIVDTDISFGDSVYYWSKSGTVSSGTFTNSTAYRTPYSYSLPAGKTPLDVVAIGISSNNNCYYWYSDGTVSRGTSDNATYYSSPVSYTLPPGQTPTTILAMSFAKQGSGNVYTWYKDGTATVGNPTNLASVRSSYPYTPAAGKLITDIVGIGIAGSNDHTYVWYNAGTTKSVSSGITNQFDYYFGATAASF